MIALLGGLGAALAWGTGTFCSARSSRMHRRLVGRRLGDARRADRQPRAWSRSARRCRPARSSATDIALDARVRARQRRRADPGVHGAPARQGRPRHAGHLDRRRHRRGAGRGRRRGSRRPVGGAAWRSWAGRGARGRRRCWRGRMSPGRVESALQTSASCAGPVGLAARWRRCCSASGSSPRGTSASRSPSAGRCCRRVWSAWRS